MKAYSMYLMVGFYVFAGINHFINPAFYNELIPDYFIFIDFINYSSGVAEIILGILLLFNRTRKVSSYLIATMLICFIPSHVYFIQIGSCTESGLCVSEWISWGRLLIIHPLLIIWALSFRNYEK